MQIIVALRYTVQYCMYLVNTVCIKGSTANEILLQNKVSNTHTIMVTVIIIIMQVSLAKDIANAVYIVGNFLKYMGSVYCG